MNKDQVRNLSFYDLEYDTRERWMSYWYQINEVNRLHPNSILVIGIGNGLVNNYLKRLYKDVVTVDIDKSLTPDYVSSILHFKSRRKFDVVLCAEVLEHLPFSQLKRATRKIYGLTNKYAVISLPHRGVNGSFIVRLPFSLNLDLVFKLPLPRGFPIGRYHYWEIGWKKFSLSRILKNFQEVGFLVLNTFLVPEKPYHRFFILKKEVQQK